ncbi:uncharacterized protein [Zea mays]|uniref:uncharacterized protein n=1 Tax=Zea mays TaxID=4577 RepID=UPI0004DE84F6|nr:uncharacterized protein LOC103644343 [Zea mays]|eukprot:XP_008665777.1 uncharacterized protein LOC103644343 [Zea mays]
MAKEGAEGDGWRVMDRRRQQVRGRSSGAGIWSLRGRANWEARGRGTWRGRGGRFVASGSSLGLDARVAVERSSGVQSEAAKKRVADVASGVSDMGKKRREELCCEICEDNHVPEECPVFNGPKPQAALCGFAGGESGFFQIPTWGAKGVLPRSDGVTAFITVKEGNVTAELVKSELSRLIPVKWNWSVQKHADGFIVPFPCRVELQRMIAMKYVHTLGGEGILVIQEVNQKIEPISYLQKAWVNVYGVPFEIRSFLPLWAVGSILGATQKVDMRYTRKMGVVRILVAVTDVNHIPESAEIVVGEGLYEIFFKVDKVLKDGRWIDNNNTGTRDRDDKEQGENDDFTENHENDIFQPEEAVEDTVMEDNSLHSDPMKPHDETSDMGIGVQHRKPFINDSVTLESEVLTSVEPTVLNLMTSTCADQHLQPAPEEYGLDSVICIADHASDGLELSTGRVGVDGNLSSLIDLAPDCSVLASGSISEEGLSVSKVSIPSLEATVPFAGREINLAFDDINIPSAADSLLIEKHKTRESTIHLGHVNYFTDVPRSVLQEALKSNSLTKRVKTEKLNQGGVMLSARRTNTDEDILSKAQRLAAKRNLEISYFQGYSLVQILETSTEGGKAPTNSRCLSSFGGGGDGSFCNAWMALECKN